MNARNLILIGCVILGFAGASFGADAKSSPADSAEPVRLRKSTSAPDKNSSPPAESKTKPATKEAEKKRESDAKETGELLPWIADYDQGLRRALAERKPVLVRAVSAGCPWCRKLEEECKTADAQKELARWTLVEIDVDRASLDAERLGVGAVPALRVLTPGGQLVASQDGYVGRRELVAWLQQHFDAASAAPDDVLAGTGEPDRAAIVRLVRHFSERNPVLREAAARRLLPYGNVAAASVVKALREGNLAAKLAAMELLRAWKAPVEKLDPWRPETLSTDALKTLDRWVETASPKSLAMERLSTDQLTEARREIDRMLAGSPAEAEAIREQLACWGTPLLPEVYDRLKRATSDQDRRRLLTLRFRLAAAGPLVLRWPGGLERLAATDSRERQKAAEELAARATADDQPLLLELFSDPDPLVREICLRGLQQIGGKESLAALVKLLEDPEPNVRAAVLKRLAENPSRPLVPQVVAYVAKETDSDLVVHAIRVLREAKGQQAVKCLMSLLANKQWQVRAEAAESLGKILGNSHGEKDVPTELKADAYVALIGLLDDPDAFVVSRAVEGLQEVDTDVAVDPLVRAAGRHPELMPKIVELLARSEKVREKALPHLRSFAKSKDAASRASAIRGLMEAMPDDCEAELAAALKDPESRVRVAGASALFSFFDRQRVNPEEYLARRMSVQMGMSGTAIPLFPEGQAAKAVNAVLGLLKGKAVATKPTTAKSAPVPKKKETAEKTEGTQKGDDEDESEKKPKDSHDQWLAKFYAGRGRPAWMTRMAEPLEKMLSAEAAEERVEAALALVPLGRIDKALDALMKTAKSQPKLVARAREVLPWLVWEKRLRAFQELYATAGGPENSAAVIQSMVEQSDARAAELFWRLLAQPQLSEDMAAVLTGGLQAAYFGRYPEPEKVVASHRREIAQATKPHVEKGTPLERLAALVILAGVDPEAAAEMAGRLSRDEKLGEDVRDDAYQITLAIQEPADATKMAVEAMSGASLTRRKLALKYLVSGRQSLLIVRGKLHLALADGGPRVSNDSEGARAPRGVTFKQLQPLLAGSDPQIAAYAGYLAALLGKPEGLAPLLRYWRQEGEKPENLDQLVYTAIASLDEEKEIAVLRQIAAKLKSHEIRDFYWTIRGMTGPEVLKLRKEIRDKVGVENLR